MGKLKKQTIAAALHVTPGRVSQYIRMGMPIASVAAALEWQRCHIQPTAARVAAIAPPTAAPAGPAPLALAEIDEYVATVLDRAKVQILASIAGNSLIGVSTADARQVYGSVVFALGEWFAGQGLPDSECYGLTGSVDEVDAAWIEAEVARIRHESAGADAAAAAAAGA